MSSIPTDLVMTFTSTTLAAPWGMVVAPSNFGPFANALLVGNLVDGSISAFNMSNGEFAGQLADSNSKRISIPGLWSLIDGDGALNAQSGAVYFTAGPNGYASGLFGMIQPGPSATPTPSKTPKPKKDTETETNEDAEADQNSKAEADTRRANADAVWWSNVDADIHAAVPLHV